MERVSNTVLLDAQVFEKISNDTNKIVAEQFQYPVELLEYTLNDEQTFKTLFNIFQNAHKFKKLPIYKAFHRMYNIIKKEVV